MLLLIIILAPVIIPLVMLGVGPGILITYFMDRCYRAGCCGKFLLIMISIPLGIIIDPFLWIGFTVYFIPKGISYLIRYFRRRR